MQKLLALLITCTVVASGCSQLATPARTPTTPTPRIDLLSDTTCKKPCVLGIVPGKTTQSEAWTILKDSQLVRSCQFIRLSIECDVVDIESVYADRIVDLIRFRIYNLTLEQLLSKYGNPDAAEVWRMPNDPPPQAPYTEARLIYTKIRALVNLDGQQRARYQMLPSTPVVSIMFLSEKMLADQGPLVPDSWHGYGDYGPDP